MDRGRAPKAPKERLSAAIRAVRFFVWLCKHIGHVPTLTHHIVDISNDSDSAHETRIPSSINTNTLSTLVREKNLDALSRAGGVKQIARFLGTSPVYGLRSNILGVIPRDIYIIVAEILMKDITISMLLVCAVLQICLGFMPNDPKQKWTYGTAITFGIFLSIFLCVFTKLFNQTQLFKRHSCRNSDIRVQVLRDGRYQTIPTFKLLVGDIVTLKNGDKVPADGLFLDGCSLAIDESSIEGGSDHVKINGAYNPFLISGTNIIDGDGRMLVTCIAQDLCGSISTQVQGKRSKLNSSISIGSLVIASLFLVVRLITHSIPGVDDGGDDDDYGEDDRNQVAIIISAAVTILVAGLPVSLLLTRCWTMAESMKKIIAANAMAPNLSGFGLLDSATIITDKTGTLTLNKMQVTEFWQGKQVVQDPLDFLPNNIIDWIRQAAVLNVADSLHQSESDIEEAIRNWAVADLGVDKDALKESFEDPRVCSYNLKEMRGFVVKRRGENIEQVHWKGVAERILPVCSDYYEDQTGILANLNDEARRLFNIVIEHMANKGLRGIAFAHKQVKEEHSDEARVDETELSLLAIVGLKEHCRPAVQAAIKASTEAGIDVKMFTEDNHLIAKASAIECGILAEHEVQLHDEAVIEGIIFRNYSEEERMEKIDHIKVVTGSTPSDKALMVECLKQKGHIVAVVTGKGADDASAVKKADISLSKDIQGTETPENESYDNFVSAVDILSWDRRVYFNVQELIHFQLALSVVAVITNIVAFFASGNVPLTAFELLWVNLIITILGAITLHTEKPSTTDQLCGQPSDRDGFLLLTGKMKESICAELWTQVIIMLSLQFRGDSMFQTGDGSMDTVFFNVFVLLQIFNEFKSWMDKQEDIFEGIRKSIRFIGAIGVIILLQVAFVELKFEGTERLSFNQWLLCVILAAGNLVPSSIFQLWNTDA